MTRRLTPDFVKTLDNWLQHAISASKEQLGAQWLDTYLTSPIWRFILSSQICGTSPWAGILMPSVDKVGRYFPLVFAVELDRSLRLSSLLPKAAGWFEQLEQLALRALEENLDLPEIDRTLQAYTLPKQSVLNLSMHDGLNTANRDGKLAFTVFLDTTEHMGEAISQLGWHLITEANPTYSLWSTTGSQTMKPCLRVYDHLPPQGAFVELMVGQKAFSPLEPTAVELPPLVNDGYQADTQEWATDSPVDPNRIRWRSFSATTTGRRRKINEDAYLECPEIGLWAVADGMGGHSAGDVASKTVIDALDTLVATGNLASYTAYATECLRTANADLLKMADALGSGRIMGSTVVVMLAVGNHCAAIWAGDSRLYQFRNGRLTQLTKDHSLDTELSDQGIIESSDPDGEKTTNIVTRAVGADPELRFDVITFEAQRNDLYLLCSDGLTNEIHNQEIENILGREACQKSTEHLISRSLERGARDNVTVVVAHAN